jgi:hypothetical protein
MKKEPLGRRIRGVIRFFLMVEVLEDYFNATFCNGVMVE